MCYLKCVTCYEAVVTAWRQAGDWLGSDARLWSQRRPGRGEHWIITAQCKHSQANIMIMSTI